MKLKIIVNRIYFIVQPPCIFKSEGTEIGRILKELLRMAMNEQVENDRDELLKTAIE